ncbi:MAG: rhodanese-like domain-containing protein, partial [Acidimicrobiales bacterium]
GRRGPRTVTVVDVRSAAEFASGHLQDAVNIPYESADFVSRISQLPPDVTYEVYGTDGMRAASAMRSAGLASARHLGEIAEAARATARSIIAG